MTDKPAGVEPEPEPRRVPADLTGGRPTQTYLRDLLSANGLRPLRQLGQNFLIDLNLLDVLANSAEITSSDVVLEVGAGTGGLTTRLAALAGRVISVEIDSGFYRLASAQVQPLENVKLLNVDALEKKSRVEPTVMEAVHDAMRELDTPHYLLVANLPFDISASLIANLLLDPTIVKSMTVTVQLEMGERLIAQPGSKDYGPLSVLVDLIGRAEIVRTLSPRVFWPRPKVTSCIVRIDVDPTRRTNLDELRLLQRFVRDIFQHRRKSLRAAIARIPGYKSLKPKLNELLDSVGLKPEHRAEQLASQQFHELFRALQALRGDEKKQS